MSKVKEIDRNLIEKIRDEISHFLEPIGEKHGINLELGRCGYSSGNFTMKLEGSLVGDDGVVLTKEAEDFKKYAHWHGLEPEDLGKTFVHTNVVHTITGLRTRAKKYPITVVDAKGGEFNFGAGSVKMLLKQEKTAPAS